MLFRSWTLTVTPLAAICLLNSSATIAPLPYLEACRYSIFMVNPLPEFSSRLEHRESAIRMARVLSRGLKPNVTLTHATHGTHRQILPDGDPERVASQGVPVRPFGQPVPGASCFNETGQ